jgi:hypothetical protein
MGIDNSLKVFEQKLHVQRYSKDTIPTINVRFLFFSPWLRESLMNLQNQVSGCIVRQLLRVQTESLEKGNSRNRLSLHQTAFYTGSIFRQTNGDKVHKGGKTMSVTS